MAVILMVFMFAIFLTIEYVRKREEARQLKLVSSKFMKDRRAVI